MNSPRSFQALTGFFFLFFLFGFESNLQASFQSDGIKNAAIYFSHPFPRQFQVLDSLIDSLATKDPKIAATALHQMEIAAKQNGEEEVWLNYRRSVLRYRYITTFNSRDTSVLRELIRDSEKLLRDIDEREYPEIAALVHINIGNSLNYKDINYDLAFDHYLKAYQLFKGLPKNRSQTRQYDLYSIALAYYNFGDYENALSLGNEINQLFPEPNLVQCFNRGMLAMACLKRKMYPSLLNESNWIMDHQKKIGMDPIWEAIGKEGAGFAHFHMGFYSAAEKHIMEAIQIRIREQKADNFNQLYSVLASIYAKTKRISLAEKYLDSSRTFGLDERNIENKIPYYEAAELFYQLKGEYRLLASYRDSLLQAKDWVENQKQIQLVHRSEMRVERDKKLKQEEEFRDQKNQSEWVRNSILGIFSVLILFAGMVFRNYRIRVRYEKALLLQKNEAMEKELSLARAQLSEYVRLMVEKNQQIRQTEIELEKKIASEQPEGSENSGSSSEIESFIRSETISTQEDWEKFSAMFSRAYPGFIEKLEKRYPVLTKAELRYLILLKLEIPQRDMALILGVGNDAIRQVISRIKRKLNLESREDFAVLLSGIEGNVQWA